MTAWHAVGGCGKLTVYSQTHGQSYSVALSRVLKSADLVLLSMPDGTSLSALHEAASVSLQPDEDLHVLGYPRGAIEATGELVRLGFSGHKLRDIVSPDVSREIQASGTPSADMDILLIGWLVPGLSGAPILDGSGARRSRIADGGLENGAAGINWAMQGKYLAELLQSTEGPHLCSQYSS